MKKSFVILLLPLLLASCNESKPTPEHVCADKDNDHLCDTCKKVISACEDGTGDGFCDICGEKITYNFLTLTIHKNPIKTTYYVGDTFDPKGMVVWGTYVGPTGIESHAVVKEGEYSYNTESLTLDDRVIIITAGSASAQLSITVTEKPAIEDEYTKTIVFHDSIYSSKFPDGTNFDQERKFEELRSYIDEQLDYYDLINSISLAKGQSRKVNEDTYLQIGTGSGNGSLKWNCKEKIYCIEIKAMAYSKYDSYNKVWYVDRNSHLSLNGNDRSLEVPEGNPEIIALEKVDFDGGVTSFTISSSGGRVLISEMTITWRG